MQTKKLKMSCELFFLLSFHFIFSLSYGHNKIIISPCFSLSFGYEFGISNVFHRGVGVIGEQPVILPNTSFEYSSACPLSTPSGRMVRWDSFAFLCSLQLVKLKIPL